MQMASKLHCKQSRESRSVAETIEARATNVTLSISATALNTSLSNTRLIITAQSITAPVDLIEVGFREGDTISSLLLLGKTAQRE